MKMAGKVIGVDYIADSIVTPRYTVIGIISNNSLSNLIYLDLNSSSQLVWNKAGEQNNIESSIHKFEGYTIIRWGIEDSIADNLNYVESKK